MIVNFKPSQCCNIPLKVRIICDRAVQELSVSSPLQSTYVVDSDGYFATPLRLKSASRAAAEAVTMDRLSLDVGSLLGKVTPGQPPASRHHITTYVGLQRTQ